MDDDAAGKLPCTLDRSELRTVRAQGQEARTCAILVQQWLQQDSVGVLSIVGTAIIYLPRWQWRKGWRRKVANVSALNTLPTARASCQVPGLTAQILAL